MDNPFKNAPHTAAAVTADGGRTSIRREQAAYPARGCKDYKFWPRWDGLIIRTGIGIWFVPVRR